MANLHSITSIRMEERPSGYRDHGENFMAFVSDEHLGNTIIPAESFDEALDKIKDWYHHG